MIGLHHQHPRWYYPLWQNLPSYKLVAVSDSDEQFLEQENQYYQFAAHSDYHELLERDDIDVVILWIEHSLMPQAVADAAKAGKHVIVEKPCAANVEGAKQILDVANEYPDIKISSPYCWRTHPVSEKIHHVIDDGLMGDFVTLQARLNAGSAQRYIRDNSPWMLKASEGGGPMWNLGVHWIDYFRWITRKEIVSVAGVATGPVGQPTRDIEDSAQALLTFEDDATATLDISYTMPSSYPGSRDIYFALRGTQGSIAWAPAWEGNTDELLVVSEHESIPENQQCQRYQIVSKSIPGYCGHMAWAWLNDFANAVNENRSPLVTPYDILAAVQVTDAYYRSLKSGKSEQVIK